MDFLGFIGINIGKVSVFLMDFYSYFLVMICVILSQKRTSFSICREGEGLWLFVKKHLLLS